MERKLPNAILFAEIERMISEGLDVRLRVQGTSMRPLLHTDDTVILKAFTQEDLQPGAIILFRKSGTHILHRLIRRRGDNLTIQGDSAQVEDEARTGDVVAVVKEVVLKSGKIIRYGSCRWSWEYRKLLRRRKLYSLLSRIKRGIIRRQSISEEDQQ